MAAKRILLISVSCVLSWAFLSGCEGAKQAGGPKTTPKAPQPTAGAPRIEVAQPIQDIGDVGPNSRHTTEFEFKNTGDAILVIDHIQATCSCTVAELAKTEYTPGESGKAVVTYHAGTLEGEAAKHLYIHSNDAVNPMFEITIKANVVLPVIAEPKMLELFLNQENAGVGDIIIKSRNDTEFAINSITSSDSIVTADFDPAVKGKEFVLKPKVDLAKAGNITSGSIRIGLNHPECKQVDVRFTAKPLYEISPPRLIIQNASPAQPIIRDVLIKSNYNQPVNIKSITSEKGYMEVEQKSEEAGGVKLQVKITPPERDLTRRYLTDILSIELENDYSLTVNCSGWYKITN